jgi:hypothetical protein
MKTYARFLAAALAIFAVYACDNHLAGNSTQTENVVAARTILVDSVLPWWSRPLGAPTVAILRFDSANFDFQQTDSSGSDLAVEDEAGIPIPFDIVYWDRQARLGRLQVRIESDLQRPESRFVLHWGQPPETRSDPVAVWQSIPDGAVLAIGSVPVADFENRNDTTLLPTRPVWETAVGDSSTISPPTYVPAGGGRGGTALSVSYSTKGPYYAVVKTPLVVGDSAKNIRAMDSLVFWVKGTKGSNLFIAFDHADAFKAWMLDTLDTSWKRIRIRPSDFVPASNPNGGNRGWVAVRDSATDLSFILNGGTSFQLDDIRIYGLNHDDLN